jgi:hypothetical protein
VDVHFAWMTVTETDKTNMVEARQAMLTAVVAITVSLFCLGYVGQRGKRGTTPHQGWISRCAPGMGDRQSEPDRGEGELTCIQDLALQALL